MGTRSLRKIDYKNSSLYTINGYPEAFIKTLITSNNFKYITRKKRAFIGF